MNPDQVAQQSLMMILLECVNQDPHATTRDLSAVIEASNATVACCLKNLGERNLISRSDPHDLAEAQAQQ